MLANVVRNLTKKWFQLKLRVSSLGIYPRPPRLLSLFMCFCFDMCGVCRRPGIKVSSIYICIFMMYVQGSKRGSSNERWKKSDHLYISVLPLLYMCHLYIGKQVRQQQRGWRERSRGKSVLQWGKRRATHPSFLSLPRLKIYVRVTACVALCYSVLQCAAVYCNVMQCDIVCCTMLQCNAVWCSVWQFALQCVLWCVLQCVATFGSVLQCVAVCCSVLQCVEVCCSMLQRVLQCVAVCCSVLQCVAVCCSILQYDAVWCSVLQCVAVCCSVQRVAVCYSVLQHVAAFWSVLQCAAA